MRPSTAVTLLNATIAVGSLVALWLCWSPWAAALVLSANIAAVVLDNGAKSLARGGE